MSPISEDVEEAVVGRGLRRHPHAAGEVAAVGDEDVVEQAARDARRRPRARISLGFQRAKTASVAQRKDTLPPIALDVVLARWATAPLMPALATFANQAVRADPSQLR